MNKDYFTERGRILFMPVCVIIVIMFTYDDIFKEIPFLKPITYLLILICAAIVIVGFLIEANERKRVNRRFIKREISYSHAVTYSFAIYFFSFISLKLYEKSRIYGYIYVLMAAMFLGYYLFKSLAKDPNNEICMLIDAKCFNDTLLIYNNSKRAKFDHSWKTKDIVLENLKTQNTLNAYNRSLDINSEDYDILENRAFLLYEMGKYPEAAIDYSNMLKINPDDTGACDMRAYVCGKFGRTAFNACGKSRGYMDDSYAWVFKAFLLKKMNNLNEALLAYDRSIKIDPNDDRTWRKKSELLIMLNREVEAMDACNKALRININNSFAWADKGYIFSKKEKFEDALLAYDRAIKINPDYDVVWNRKGLSLAELHRYSGAISSFNKAIEIEPDYADAYFNKSVVLHKTGNIKGALVAYKKAKELNPEYNNDMFNDIKI